MLYELLSELQQTPGKKAKVELIKEHHDSMLVKTMFLWAVDPRFVFNIGKKTLPKYEDMGYIADRPMYTYTDMIDILQYILNNKPRGKKLDTTLNAIMCLCTCEQWEVFSRIVLKDLKCGVGDGTVNKVWPDLIYISPYMGALSDTRKHRDALHIEDGAYVQLKCDGAFMNVIVGSDSMLVEGEWLTNGVKTVYTCPRWGRPIYIPQSAPLYDALLNLPIGVYHGELVFRDDSYDNGYLPRHVGNGLFNSLEIEGGFMEQDDRRLDMQFIAWDVVSSGVFYGHRKSDTDYAHRFAELGTAIPKANDYAESVTIVPSSFVTSWEEADQLYQATLARGFEGCVVKRADNMWKSGKPASQVKMKVEVSCDMLYTGIVPHSKHPELTGSLIVESACGDLQATCGGLTKEAMAHGVDFWRGKVVRMKFNALSPYGRFDHPRVHNGSPAVWDGCVRERDARPNTKYDIEEIYNAAIGLE